MPAPSFAAANYSENFKSRLLKLLLFKTFFGAFYTLLKKEEILGNANRYRIYQVIADFPGIRYSDIMEKLKVASGLMEHHLDILEREKVIISYHDGRFKRYRLHPDQENKSAAEVQKIIEGADEAVRVRILGLIEEKNAITQNEICKKLRGSKQIISYHVRKLEADGMIRTEKSGLTKKCYKK